MTRKRTHRFGPEDIVRRALSGTYPYIDKLLKNKQYQPHHWIWFNDNLHTFVKMHKHVRSYRRDLVSPYGLDSTPRLALMLVFCKLDHHGTYFGISLICFHLTHINVRTPKIPSVDPWGSMNPRLGTTDSWTPGWEPLSQCPQPGFKVWEEKCVFGRARFLFSLHVQYNFLWALQTLWGNKNFGSTSPKCTSVATGLDLPLQSLTMGVNADTPGVDPAKFAC